MTNAPASNQANPFASNLTSNFNATPWNSSNNQFSMGGNLSFGTGSSNLGSNPPASNSFSSMINNKSSFLNPGSQVQGFQSSFNQN